MEIPMSKVAWEDGFICNEAKLLQELSTVCTLAHVYRPLDMKAGLDDQVTYRSNARCQ